MKKQPLSHLKTSLVVGCVALTAFGCKRRSQDNDSEFYIFGGESVAADDPMYRSNVALGKVESTGRSFPAYCSGVIVSDRTVLTTTACFDKSEKQVFARIGNDSNHAFAKAFVLHTEPIEIAQAGKYAPGLALVAFDNGAFSNPITKSDWFAENAAVNINKGPFWIYALGQNNAGVFGELRRFSTNLIDADRAGFRAGGSLATGDEGGGLFVEVEGKIKLLGIVRAVPNIEKIDNTTFIDIRKYQAWIDCAALNLQVFSDHAIGLPAECAVLQVYGLEKPN